MLGLSVQGSIMKMKNLISPGFFLRVPILDATSRLMSEVWEGEGRISRG